MINKKGSNVSYAIAFMIFIGFVIFLLGIIKPLEKVNTDKSIILENLQNKIIENVSSKLEIISVNQAGCNGPFQWNIENGVYKIYKINNSKIDLDGCSVGLIRTEDYVFTSKIRNLINTYNKSYDALKYNFNIPRINDFSFSFTYENGTKIETIIKENPSTDVFAKLIPIDYFNGNSRKRGYLKITLW